MTSAMFQVVAVLLCLTVLPAWGQDPVATELAQLQGTWEVVSAEQRGGPFDVIKGAKLQITGHSFFLRTAAGSEFKGELQVNTQASPWQLDFVHADGTIWEAIYSLDEDGLRLNYVEAGGPDKRPTLFATSSESPGTVIVLSRAAHP